MRFTRSQLIVVIVLGILTLVVFSGLVGIIVRNSRQMSQILASPASSLSASGQTGVPSPSPTPTATPAPTPPPTPTPTPLAPQTRYDLQVAREPENPTLRLERGYAYMALEAYAYAIGDFEAAIALDATLAEAYVGRGEAHFHLKEWSTALEDFKQALTLNPDQADAHAWRGHLLAERGEYDMALQDLSRAVVLDGGDVRKHIWLAQMLFSSGNPGGAEMGYTTALLLDSRSVEAVVGRAMAKAEQGDLDGALGDLYSARDIASSDPAVLNGWAWFYAWYQGDHLDEAEPWAQLAVAGARDGLEKARYLHTLGWVYYREERYGDAVTALQEAARLATVEGEVVYKDITEHLEQAQEAQ